MSLDLSRYQPIEWTEFYGKEKLEIYGNIDDPEGQNPVGNTPAERVQNFTALAKTLGYEEFVERTHSNAVKRQLALQLVRKTKEKRWNRAFTTLAVSAVIMLLFGNVIFGNASPWVKRVFIIALACASVFAKNKELDWEGRFIMGTSHINNLQKRRKDVWMRIRHSVYRDMDPTTKKLVEEGRLT